jgi:ribose 5-phosphate isomerase
MVILLPLIKPFISAVRFASTIGAGTGEGEDFAIAATSFTDDDGAAVTAFPASFAYYNLYINGVLQTADVSTVTTTAITIPDGDILNGGLPVVIEFVVN